MTIHPCGNRGSGTDMEGTTIKTNQAHRTAKRNYCLAPLVFVSATRHGVVFLDIKRNRYSAIGYPDALKLAEHLDGIPILEAWRTEPTSACNTSCDDSGLMNSLLSADVVTLTPRAKCEIVSTQIPLDGVLTSIGDEITATPSIGLWQIATFLYCLVWSTISLRLLPFRCVVRGVHRRRHAALKIGYKFNLSRASELVATFRGIRPYFFLPKDNCLLHALTLVKYLAHHAEYPVLVFGIKTDPWSAHAWVQNERYLLDCNPEKVCHLEQILGV